MAKRWQWQVDGKGQQNTEQPTRRVNHGSFTGHAHHDATVGNSPSGGPKKLPQPPQSPRNNDLKSATSNLQREMTMGTANINHHNHNERDDDERDDAYALGQSQGERDLADILPSEELMAMEKFEKSFRDQTGQLLGASGGQYGSGDALTKARNRKTIPVRPAKQSDHVLSFSLPDTEEWITFGEVDVQGKRVVKTACFAKIIEKMTANVPLVEMDDVLLCYHSFCLAGELLDALILRYDSPSREDEKTVRLRILNFVRKWSGQYWFDWILDPTLSARGLAFLNRICATNSSPVALTIRARLENRMQFEEEQANEQKNKQATLGPPPESLTPPIPQPSIFQYDPVEISRQMTIIEWDIWSHIQHWELLGLAWTKKDKETTAKNVVAMTERFNLVSDWVVNVMCTSENNKIRIKNFQIFLRVADELRILGNYNGVLEIMSGLRRGPVDRLKKAFNAAIKAPNFNKIFQELDMLTNSAKAYLNMRNAIKTVNPPVIPYLGMYQTDLLMIDSGNPDEVNGLINLTKYRLSTETIKKIRQYQLTGYSLRVVDDLYQQLLTTLNPYKMTETMQYELSYFLEPREGKDPGPKPVHLDNYLMAAETVMNAYYESFSIKKKLLEFEANTTEYTGSLFVEMSFIIEKAITSSDSIFGVALLSTYRQFIPASTILNELSKHYTTTKNSNDTMMRIGNLLKTWIVQYWKDFEEEPELLTLMDDLFKGADFAVYKATILQPLINKNKSFEIPPPVPTEYARLDIFTLTPLEYAKQLIHYTFDYVVSKININKIFIEAASINNPRLVDFNINSAKDQAVVFKLAQGKYSGIQGIELIAYRKKKKAGEALRDCFLAKKAIEWFVTMLCCSSNGALGWFRYFQNNHLISPVEEAKDFNEIADSDSVWKFNVASANPIYDIFSWEVNDYVSNFRNNIYKHLTVIHNFVLREIKKESETRGALALHQFIMIGQELIKHHNWYTALALVAALHSLLLPEYQCHWERLPPKDRHWFVTTRNLILDGQELRKTLYAIPSVGPFNSSFTMIHILVDDLTNVNRKYPNVVDSENKVNMRRILELSKLLESHTRTSSMFPPNFEKYQQIQNFIVSDR